MIVDKYGKPISLQELKKPQTSATLSLHREFAQHPGRGLTPERLANILIGAEQGDLIEQAELAEDMEEKDAHLYAELSKRKRAPLTLDWTIEPPPNASRKQQKNAEILKELVANINDFEDVTLNMLDALMKGYSCLEIATETGETGWTQQDGLWQIKAVQHRPATWFTVNPENQNELRLRDLSYGGTPLQPFGWVKHIHRAKAGYIARGGLARILAWPFLFKNYSIRDLAEFLEIYGLPVRLGKYGINATEIEKTKLLRAVVDMGRSAAGIIPDGMAVEFLEGGKGQEGAFALMISWAESSMSKAILGGTLTSQADGKTSTNALGMIHNEVRWDLTISDVRQLEGTKTRDIVYPLAVLNGFGEGYKFSYDTTWAEDVALYADAIPKLVDVGFPVPIKYLQEKLQIPEPAEGEPILQRSQPGMPLMVARYTHKNTVSHTHENTVSHTHESGYPLVDSRLHGNDDTNGNDDTKGNDDNDDTVGKYTTQLDRKMQPILTGWVGQVHAVVEQAKSLEDVRDRIFDLYPQMESKEFATIMQMARMTAELSGRFELNEEVSDG